MIREKTHRTCLFLMVLTAALVTCRCGRLRVEDTPSPHDATIEKLRLIMTKQEKLLLKDLKSPAEKRAFIEHFWEMRDPVPATAENENRTEFENRVAFANEWLSDIGTFHSRTRLARLYGDRGWRTDKGRIFIVLGMPDLVSYSDSEGTWQPMQLYKAETHHKEAWFYPRLDHLYVGFYRSLGGRWRAYYGPELSDAMDRAILMLISDAYRPSFEAGLHFKSRWKNGQIRLHIPAERVNFKQEEEGRLRAEFRIVIQVVKDGGEAGRFEKTRAFVYEEKEVLNLDTISFDVPFPLKEEEGRYSLEITLIDTMSLSGVNRSTSHLKFMIG
jgi:GWxTD domain-containing protein